MVYGNLNTIVGESLWRKDEASLCTWGEVDSNIALCATWSNHTCRGIECTILYYIVQCNGRCATFCSGPCLGSAIGTGASISNGE